MSDKITTTVRLSPELHRALKVAAAHTGLRLSEIVEEGVRLWAESRDIELPPSR